MIALRYKNSKGTQHSSVKSGHAHFLDGAAIEDLKRLLWHSPVALNANSGLSPGLLLVWLESVLGVGNSSHAQDQPRRQAIRTVV